MKKILHTTRTGLIVFLLSIVSITMALPPETEYVGLIPQTGTSVSGPAQGYEDDGYWGPNPIGFTFNFFGNDYTEFYVTSNGLVTFGSSSTQYSNNPIPTSSGANNYIAPFWDDIVVHATGDIMYQTIGTAPNRKLIVQFNNMSFFGSPILLGTFQVILYEGTNCIQTQYRSIVDLTSDRASGNSATIGLENADGTAGVTYSYNTAGAIETEKAIKYCPDGGGSYTVDGNAIYEGVLLVDAIARAGIPNLVSPAYGSTIGDNVTFQWDAAANASSYYVVISQNSDLSSPIHTSADLTTLTHDYTLTTGQTYYWSVNAKNSADVVTWSEIWSFTTSSAPPLVAVPQTIYLEQGQQRTATLMFTGGDAGSKTATITSLPAEGDLYQYDGGALGAQITTVPTDLTDASFRAIYVASGAAGNGVGNFDFHFSDATGTSTDVTYTVNVSPPGIPNFLFAAKETDRVEITFDRNMADPTGKHLEFEVKDNGVSVTSSSCNLKAGDPTTIVVYVSPSLNVANTITVAYTKGTVLSESGGVLESFDFQLAGKMAQVINFAALADKTYGDPSFSVSATASSGLSVSFSSSNSTVASVSGTTVTVNSAGAALINAYQAGDATYAEVNYQRTQTVNKAAATIVLSDLAQTYTGSGVAATATTTPAGLTTKIEYDGSITLPVTPGSYAVSAEIDDANYQGTTTGTLVISDNTAPVADVPTLATVTEECSATLTAPTATDDLDGSVTATTSTTFPVSASTTVTWNYTDAAGNTSSQTQDIVIDDTTDPVTPTLADVTDECSATVVAPTTTDNCAGTITGTTSDPLTYTTQGTHVIAWTFDDGNGNSIVVNQNVVIDDATDPVTPTLADVTGECSATAVAPTTTDACAGTITGTTTDPLSYDVQGTHVIAWTFDDGNGNSIVVNQNVVIDDATDPDTPTLADVTGECSATAVAPTTTDACAGTITGTTTDPLSYDVQGTHVIAWTFDDGNGNSIVVNQNVVIDDATDPDTPTLADVTGECSATAVAPTTTDACAGTITGTTTDPLSYDVQGTHVIAWTFDDGNGNSIVVNQNVVIDDATDPVTPTLADVTGECSATAVAPTTTDACAGTITGTTTDPLSYDVQGTHVIAWTFDDGNGNSIVVNQNVVIDDATDPDTPTLADVTGECSATAVAPTTTDACAGTITGTTTDPLTYDVQGTHVIAWTFDDGNGNSIVVNQNVVVDDATDPDTPTLADVTGECSATAVAPTTTDACAGTITGTTTDPLTYDVQGTHVIAWTFDDGNGNSIVVNQNVVVDDATDPDMPTLADVTGECSATAVAPTTTDACAGTITGTTTDPLSYDVQGTHVIAWTFDDGNGNSIVVNQNVVIEDLTDPSIICPADFTVMADDNSNTYTVMGVELDPVTTDDNCGVASAYNDVNMGVSLVNEVFNLGVTTVTWTVEDISGRLATCTFDVTVDEFVGIVEALDEDVLNLYPNPSHGQLILNYSSGYQGKVQVKVLDMSGREVFIKEFNKSSKELNKQIDIQSLSTGVYYVVIQSESNTVTKKLIRSDK